jgi:hypothetical protein
MYPCSTCHRHLRDTDRTCPFCGVVQSTVVPPTVDGLGAFSLTVLLLGAAACSKDTVSATTTTESSSTSESGGTSTTVSDTSDSSQDSTDTDTGDTANNTTLTSGSFYAGATPDFSLPADCDPFEQDCPDGEKCVPYGSTGGNWDANKCVPITGSGQPGDPCVYGGTATATDDCGAESHCWDVMDVDGMAIGVCTVFCEGTPDDPICPMGTDCLIANSSISLCISSCDPMLQDCGAGLGCFWFNNAFSCIFTTQDIPVGEPCGFVNDCAVGLICMAAELMPSCAGVECCASFCSLAAPVCPQMGTECAAFFDPGAGPAGYEDTGVCVLPGA